MNTVKYPWALQRYILTLCFVVAISACAVKEKSTSPELADSGIPLESNHFSPTLYDQLGGKEGLSMLSDKFIIELAGDDRVRPRFAKTDIGRFSRVMQEHLCEITDGPCEYSGDSMKRVHGGMNIRSSEFNAVVEALMRAMDSLQLPVSTQNQLLARLAVFRPDIVGH